MARICILLYSAAAAAVERAVAVVVVVVLVVEIATHRTAIFTGTNPIRKRTSLLSIINMLGSFLLLMC